MTPNSTHPFVSPQRERLAEAVRHLIDAVLTVEDATEEQLGTAADLTEGVARHLGRVPRADDPIRGTRGRAERDHTDYLPRSPLVGEVSPPLARPITPHAAANSANCSPRLQNGDYLRGKFSG